DARRAVAGMGDRGFRDSLRRLYAHSGVPTAQHTPTGLPDRRRASHGAEPLIHGRRDRGEAVAPIACEGDALHVGLAGGLLVGHRACPIARWKILFPIYKSLGDGGDMGWLLSESCARLIFQKRLWRRFGGPQK